MSTKKIATALLAAGMVLGSLSAASAACSYGNQSKPAKQSQPSST